MLKTVFTIGAILCFVQLACTSPALREKRDDDLKEEEDSTPLGIAIGEFFSMIIKASFMYCETIYSASLTHCSGFLLQNDTVMDRRNHVISASIMELLTDLRTMEHVLEVYSEESKKVFSTSTIKDNLINTYFEKLDKAMAEDSVIGDRYKEIKEKYEKELVLKPDHLDTEAKIPAEDRIKMMANNSQSLRYILNFSFVGRLNNSDNANKKKGKFSVMANTLVEMSKKADKLKYEKLQKIYKESIAEVATQFISADLKEAEAAKALFRKLNDKINADPSLKEEFEEQKKKVGNYESEKQDSLTLF